MLQKPIRKQKSDLPSNRGKPTGLKETELDVPKIWTNFHECSAIIKFLYEEGRHIGLHQAGRDFDNEERKKEKEQIKAKAKYYEIAQNIANKLFGVPRIAARLTIFFFRLPNDQSYQTFQQQIDEVQGKLRDVLLRTSFLFNKKFIDDWIMISKLYKDGKNIIEEMIKDKHTPKQFSQIFQNAYIKYILADMMENNNSEKYSTEANDLDEDFLDFVKLESTKKKVSQFISELLELYLGQNAQQQYYPDCQMEVDFDLKSNVSDFINNNDQMSDDIYMSEQMMN